jgi:uncharacterized protein YprB with RNaseH-like and TPR domain
VLAAIVDTQSALNNNVNMETVAVLDFETTGLSHNYAPL